VAAALLLARAAQAYPQWQFSSGVTRCTQCHFSPAGGGLVTGYARDAVGEELSTWTGDGSFAHGVVDLPKWLALQLDTRAAFLARDNPPRGRELSVFPMQFDLSGRVGVTEQISVIATVGLRGQVRGGSLEVAPDNFQPRAGSRIISREHFAMWRPAAIGPYVRAGRFMVPYGLRLAEHYLFIRRDLGQNLLDENYGASGGFIQNTWELHVTVFTRDFLRNMGGNETGAAVLYEKRVGEGTALGAQARFGTQPDARRVMGGGYVKQWIEPARLLLQGEANVVRWQAGGFGRNEFVGFFGPSAFPIRGLMVMPFVERKQTDISVQNTATNGYGAQVNWWPYPHFELTLLGRAQDAAGPGLVARSFLAILHYYL
jgi:hypothetical protein